MRFSHYALALVFLASASSSYAFDPEPADAIAFDSTDCTAEQPQYCGESCSCNGCCCGRSYLFPQVNQAGINFHGWLNGGYIWKTEDPPSKYNGPYNAVDRANEGMMNQLMLGLDGILRF